MNDIKNQKCVPCEGGTPPLETPKVQELTQEISDQWRVIPVSKDHGMKIARSFVFKNFLKNMEFVNAVAKIAEAEGHHPDMHISYNKLKIELWTHAVGGLSLNDFILASKIDTL